MHKGQVSAINLSSEHCKQLHVLGSICEYGMRWNLWPLLLSALVDQSCVCQSATLIDFDSNRFSSVFLLYLSFDRTRNRIDNKDLLVQRLNALIAKNWVDGSGVNLITLPS